MFDFNQRLDRYLTQEPPDDFTPFVEKVYEYLPDNVYEDMDKLRFIDSEIESAFLWHCLYSVSAEMTALHLINLFYKLVEKEIGFKMTHARAEHLGKFYANNLFLL